MKITLWLAVYKSGQAWSPDSIWYKEVETSCVPVPDLDEVTLWAYEDDPSDGPMCSVKSRHMRTDGLWDVQLYDLAVDPSSVSLGGKYQTWLTADSGDPIPKLQENEWQEYGT